MPSPTLGFRLGAFCLRAFAASCEAAFLWNGALRLKFGSRWSVALQGFAEIRGELFGSRLTVERVKGHREHGDRLEIRCWSWHASGRDFFEQGSNCLGLAGEDSGGCDVGEGLEDEGAFGDSGMGEG